MKRLRAFFDNNCQAGAPVILCGDFNVAPEDRDIHNPQLWQERIMCSQAERQALDEIKRWGFTDTFRLHHDEGGQFSWWDYRAGALQISFQVTFPFLLIFHLLFALSSVVFFYGGLPFLKGWIDEMKTWKPGMMTLIGFAITVAYIYSVATVFGLQGMDFFWELTTLILVMLLGHWIEMKSIAGALQISPGLMRMMSFSFSDSVLTSVVVSP